MQSKNGLVIGKFYPPHKGHVHLIRESAKQTEKLTVLVLGSSFQKIKIDDRVAWLNAEFEGTNVTVHGVKNDAYDDYEDANVWTDHEHIIRAGVRNFAPEGVDTVFTSEEYGSELAERLGARNVLIDLDRRTFPISGTACRKDLYGNWSFLPDSVRKALTTRIVIVGGESTGTTTLSEDIAEHYKHIFKNVGWIPEYGRQYTIDKIAELQVNNPEADVYDIVWGPEDFRVIGEKQTQLERDYVESKNASPLIICDTDALATSLWEHRYCENDSIGKPDYANDYEPRDLYIVTNHEGVEFFQDGIRDGEHIREDMTFWFEDELTKRNESWVILTGSKKERLIQAVRMIDNILSQKSFFQPWEM